MNPRILNIPFRALRKGVENRSEREEIKRNDRQLLQK